jgi:hypothetical protein
VKTSLPKLYFALFGASIVAVACGARSGLDVPRPPEHDAGVDAGPDVVDAPPDAPPDVVLLDDCVDAGTTYIYLMTEENELYSFYPLDGTFTDIGEIDCFDNGATPFSMAVDRSGIAYVVFQNNGTPALSGDLFRVSTADATCQPTAYQPVTFGAGRDFGMGFSANVADAGETLFVASDDSTTDTPESLGTIDVSSFQLDPVGTFPSVIGSAELTGTGDGKLYAFGVHQITGGLTTYKLVQIDKDTAGVISEIPINMPSGTANINAWAFAFWGGNFYFFTSPNFGSSLVSRYVPVPGDTVANAELLVTVPNTIVGAGVSTCAPQH